MISLVANPEYLSCHNCSFDFCILLEDCLRSMCLIMWDVRVDFEVDVPKYGLCDAHLHLNDHVKAVSSVPASKCDHVANCIHGLGWKSFPQVLIRHLLSSLEFKGQDFYIMCKSGRCYNTKNFSRFVIFS